eukprot:scaffold20030_cov15-Prasinocladus_malaysianus.AAC.1
MLGSRCTSTYEYYYKILPRYRTSTDSYGTSTGLFAIRVHTRTPYENGPQGYGYGTMALRRRLFACRCQESRRQKH